MRIAVALVIALTLVGCQHEPTAEEINQRFYSQHVRDELDLAQLRVHNAELGEELAQKQGKKVDPMPLLQAKAHLLTAQSDLDMQRDREQLERALSK